MGGDLRPLSEVQLSDVMRTQLNQIIMMHLRIWFCSYVSNLPSRTSWISRLIHGLVE